MFHKLESRLPGEISTTSDNADDTTLMAESEGEIKEPLDEGKRGEWKNWLKTQHSKNSDHGIQFHHVMANRWGKNGKSDRFYFLGLQITVGSDCSHEIKRRLLLGRKAITNLDSILKKARQHFANKGLYGFSSSHSCMDVGHKAGWAPKNWFFRTVVLEKTSENPFGQQGAQTS